MDDPRFAKAVKAMGRRKLILSGITTDFCVVYPALTLIAQGYHVLVPIDATGSWTPAINDAAMQRLMQAGATPTNVQSIAGGLMNASMNADAAATRALMPDMLGWLGAYTPAPSLISMNAAHGPG